MRFHLMIGLTVLVLIQGYSQTSFLETKALAFFRDSIRQGLPVKGQGDIWFDGFLIQDTIDKAQVQRIVLEGFLTWKLLGDKKLTATQSQKYEAEKKTYEEQLNHWETVIPHRTRERLESIGSFQKTNKLRFERFLRKRLNLRIRQAFKFAAFNWIEIRLDKSDYEYGYLFYLKMDDRGNVLDWSDAYWIQ